MATNQPKTLRDAILFFADYENCRKAVEAIRWPDGVVACPTCGSENVTYLETQRRYKCYGKHPKAQFSLKVGTIFEDSAVGLEKWLPALWLITNCKNGISSYELARALGVTQKTAWFMLSRLRLALQAEHGGKLSGDVEADETFIGGKARNMHAAKRKRLGISQSRSMIGKVAVMGLLERHGEDGQPGPHSGRQRTGRSINSARPSASTSKPARRSTLTRSAPTTAWQHAGYVHRSSTTPRPTSTARSTPTAWRTSGRC